MPLDNTNSLTKLGVACSRSLLIVHISRRCRALHDLISLGLHTRNDYVGHGMPSSPLENTWLDNIMHFMPLYSLDSTLGRMLSDMACYHSPSAIHTFGRRRAWMVNIVLGQQTQSDNVGRSMQSSPLDYIYKKMTLSVA